MDVQKYNNILFLYLLHYKNQYLIINNYWCLKMDVQKIDVQKYNNILFLFKTKTNNIAITIANG